MNSPSWFVNLTDLHLVSADKDNAIGDYSKSDVIPTSERPKIQLQLRKTLEAVKIAINQEPDAVIVNGDMTDVGTPDGLDLLPEVLSCLGELNYLRSRTVVVPGNHDIAQDTPPSSKERYANFISLVRNQSFITPALEGIDIDASSGAVLSPATYDPKCHFLLDEQFRWVIVPINCANYYGSVEPLKGMTPDQWDALLNLAKSFNPSDPKVPDKYLMNLRRRDVARVSEGQMLHIGALLRHIEGILISQGQRANSIIKFAVIHHQLLPVSNSEEFKPFEGLTNLGAFRRFLSDEGFHVVLHGHKHVKHSYWDHVYDFNEGAGGKARRILVLSGTSIRSSGSDGDAGRLLEFNNRVFAPSISVRDIPMVWAGQTLKPLKPKSYALYEMPEPHQINDANAIVIEGILAEDVYERLIALFDNVGPDVERYNIICQVHDPASLERLADIYPQRSGAYPKTTKQWFNEVVSWWQYKSPDLKGSIHFNHGSRIRRYDGNIDQLSEVIDMLKSGATSRATVTLLNPREGGLTSRAFPSFCSVQFTIRNTAEGKRLDCLGYFRKQEVRYWWPINLEELSRLQKEVYDDIVPRHNGLQLGVLTSIAAVAVRSEGLPRVAIPAVDRAHDLVQAELWNMVYALFVADFEGRKQYEQLWYDYLLDLIPPDARDHDGVPVALAGVKYLYTTTMMFANNHPDGNAKSIGELLGRIYEKNDEFATKTNFGTNNDSDGKLKKWRIDIEKIVTEIRSLVAEIFA